MTGKSVKAWGVFIHDELFAVCMTRKPAREMIWHKGVDTVRPVLITEIKRKRK